MARTLLTTLLAAGALALPTANAFALTRERAASSAPKKIVKTVTVTGPAVKCHAWGNMVVQLTVVKTEVTSAGHTNVAIKITAVNWPTYPDHTPRSKYINAQALPLLQQETLQLQANAAKDLQNIAGASNTTVSWQSSLQAALLLAEKP